MNCIICDSSHHQTRCSNVLDLEYQTYAPVNFIRCNSCGLISQSPLPKPQDIPTFYPKEYRNFLPSGEGIFAAVKRMQYIDLAEKISKHIKSRNTKILEIGFGNGQLLLALKHLGFYNLYGCDMSDAFAEELRRSGIRISVCNVEEYFPFNTQFDVILMNNVIEHFLNPFEIIKQSKSKLTDNGSLIMITPNSSEIGFSIFNKFWAGLHTPRHIYIFNTRNIKKLGNKLGFSSVAVYSLTDIGQWAISVQNILQNCSFTRIKLRNGMAWYLPFLGLVFYPVAFFQNLQHNCTSMFCVLKKTRR